MPLINFVWLKLNHNPPKYTKIYWSQNFLTGVGLGCRNKANCQHMGPGPMGDMHSKGGFSNINWGVNKYVVINKYLKSLLFFILI